MAEGTIPYPGDARLYDLDARAVVKDDIPFYIARAATAGGDVLELACGTGRVAIPLAQAGHQVWGIDLSEHMLARFQEKADRLPTDVRSRLHFSRGDMASFDLGRTFPLIIIPFRSFQLLTEESQQRGCLESVRQHLSSGGRFILDVFKPYTRLDSSWVRGEETIWRAIDPETGQRVRRTDIRSRIDVEKQIIYPELVYYLEQEDGSETRIVEKLAMKYYYEEHMRSLLEGQGFTIEEALGYYDGRPISEGPELVFVCS